MILYIAPTPMNKLDKKDRVAGWHFIPLDRKAKEAWREMILQLKDKNVERVISSDLNQEAANIAGNDLHIPVVTEFAFRRFNVGTSPPYGHHAAKLEVITDILKRLEQQWKINPDTPIKGGDSLTSWERRFGKRFNSLLSITGTVLFIAEIMTINFIRNGMDSHALIPNGNSVRYDKIYKVTTNQNDASSKVTSAGTN